MLEHVDVGERSLSAYRGIAPDALLDDLVSNAEALRGARVLHVNATPYGGGVSELLRSVVPLLNDLGLVADWRVISGDEEFFRVTKRIHNALQGDPRALEPRERSLYRQHNAYNAEILEEEYDFVFLHDPQPAALLHFREPGSARWVWRCHIDTSEPNAEVWEFLAPFLAPFDAAVFTMQEFVPPSLPIDRVEIVPPAIDPLSPKNLDLHETTARQVLSWIGISLDRPLVTQVARFDPWKDPLGVVAAYELARKDVPDLQLALVGSMALDDPEGWEVHRTLQAKAEEDRGVHVFTNLTGVGNIEVNAFQRLSDVVVQKSLREGFGLVVSEALWKGTPVVAGRAGGIPLQMADGVGGSLVEDVESCAEALVRLLRDPEESRERGRRGRERVREHFLLPRLLLNEVALMRELAAERPIARAAEWQRHRDPVCGMAIGEETSPPTATHDGRSYVFCSEACRARFLERPERFVAKPSS